MSGDVKNAAVLLHPKNSVRSMRPREYMGEKGLHEKKNEKATSQSLLPRALLNVTYMLNYNTKPLVITNHDVTHDNGGCRRTDEQRPLGRG